MLKWMKPSTSFIKSYMLNKFDKYIGSDTNPINVYISGFRNNCLVTERDGVVFRYYTALEESHNGYGFPLYANELNLQSALKMIQQDSLENNRPMKFCYLDNLQCDLLVANFNSEDYSFKLTLNNSDYIHKASTFTDLSGLENHKRRNLLNRFYRMYCFDYEKLSNNNVEDAVYVAHKWLDEKIDDEHSKSRYKEMDSMVQVLRHLDDFNLLGGIVYVDDEPVAMTIASKTNDRCIDIHFEKSFGQYAKNGAYVILEHFFSLKLDNEDYLINWEGDMGIESIRFSKSISHAKMHHKFYGTIKGDIH